MTAQSGTGPVSPTVSASAVALAIADFLARTETERLRLFRAHIQLTVVRTSLLLLELAAMEQIDLEGATALMQPPRNWPWRPMNDAPSSAWKRHQAHRLLVGLDLRRAAMRFERLFVDPGVVIRGFDHLLGRFAICPCGDTLAFASTLGPCRLSVFGSTAMMRLPEPLPDSLVTAMPGRRIGGIIDHPLLRDRDYLIREVVITPSNRLPILTFNVPLVPYAMVWPEERS